MINQETKVGLFLIMAFSLILVSILFLGKVRLFRRSHTYYVDFTNVEALPPKAAVKVAGVEVGKVDDVELVNGRARVTIDINHGVLVYPDAKVRIGSTGIIGTRYVEVDPGTPAGDPLPEGSVINGVNGTSIEAMVSKLSSIFDEDSKYGNAVDNLKATLAHINHVTAAWDEAMGQRSQDLTEIVSNIRDLSASAKAFTKDLEEISSEHKDDVKVALEKFRSVAEKLDNIMAKIDRGEGTIGALVSDEKTAAEVKETITSVKETAWSAKQTLGRVGRINAYWDYRYRYDTLENKSKSDLGLKLVPRPGKFYAFGVTNVGPYEARSKTFEKKDAWTFVMGSDLGPFTGFAGVIRSSGGVGLNFRPLWKFKKLDRRVEIETQAYDTTRDKTVEGVHVKGTILDAGLRVAVNRWWWVGVRQEDILDRSAFQVYTNIIFRDEDLAAMLGIAAVAR